jgi:hypothetical protein
VDDTAVGGIDNRCAASSYPNGESQVGRVPMTPADTHVTTSSPRSATSEAQLSRILVLVIIASVAARLLIGSLVGLTYDETILVVKAHHLHLSYFDHPPLASLLMAAMRWLTGSDDALVLRLPTIGLCAGTTWLIFRTGAMLFSPLAGFCGALALALSPFFGLYLGVLAVTDEPLLFFIAAATYCLCHALFEPKQVATAGWLAAGLFAGLALLSKSFIAGLVMLGVLVFLATSPRHRHWLARPAPYIATGIALIVVSPVIVWNARNGWVSFQFPGGHSLEQIWTFAPVSVLAYLGLQAIVMLPWIWVGLVASLLWGLSQGPQNDRVWFLTCIAAVPLAVFTIVRLLTSSRNGIHWPASGYLLLFPLLGRAIERAMESHWTPIQHLLRATVLTVVVAVTVFITHVLTGWAQWITPEFQERDPIVADMVDWDELRDVVARHQPGDRSTVFFGGTRWEDCAKIEVAIRVKAPVLCFTPTPELYAYLIDQRQLLGKDSIIVTRRESQVDVMALLAPYFDRIEPLDTIVITRFRTRATRLDLYLGRNLRAVYPWPYGPYHSRQN